MAEHTTSASIEHLLTGEVAAALGRSGYGDWQAITTADAVSLSFGFPGPETFPEAELTAAVDAVLAENGACVLQYGADSYADRLEAFVAEREQARGIDGDRTGVTLTNGATHAIDMICRAFLSPGDVVAVEAPTFMGALSVFHVHGVEVLPVPVDENGVDAGAFTDLLAGREQRGEPLPTLLYTIPNFQNPTGTTLPRERRERLLAIAAEYDFAVLEDDAYGALRYDGEPEPPLAALAPERVLRVGTFSKTIAPGLRLGWVVGPERAVEAVDTVAAGGTNTFTRSVAGWYCDAGHLEESLPALRATYERRRDRMLESLDAEMPAEATWTEPAGGFFTWVELPDGVDTRAMLEDAMANGVTYLPGSMFYEEGGPTNRLRLSYSYVPPEEIETGIALLAETVRERL
jgi:2-aminoadipate transaminase